jgi:hypothetical protein
MSAQMAYIYVKATQHVLSYVTSVAAPPNPLAASDVATPSLAIRNVFNDDTPPVTVPSAVFKIDPNQLDVLTGDVIDDAQVNPRNYSVDSSSKTVKALAPSATLTIDAKTTGVKLTLAPPPANPLPALLLYPGSDPAKSDVISTTISGGSVTLTPSGLSTGQYVLALVSGFPPVISEVA